MTPVMSNVVIGVALVVASIGAVQLAVWLGEIAIHRWRYYVACRQIARELFPPTGRPPETVSNIVDFEVERRRQLAAAVESRPVVMERKVR